MGKKIASGKKIVGKRVSGEIHTLQKHGIDKGDDMLLADVYGVGNVLTERLAKAGFLTVGDVRKNPEKALEVEGFGPKKLAVLGIKAPKKQKKTPMNHEVFKPRVSPPKYIDEIVFERDINGHKVVGKLRLREVKPTKYDENQYSIEIYQDGKLIHKTIGEISQQKGALRWGRRIEIAGKRGINALRLPEDVLTKDKRNKEILKSHIDKVVDEMVRTNKPLFEVIYVEDVDPDYDVPHYEVAPTFSSDEIGGVPVGEVIKEALWRHSHISSGDLKLMRLRFNTKEELMNADPVKVGDKYYLTWKSIDRIYGITQAKEVERKEKEFLRANKLEVVSEKLDIPQGVTMGTLYEPRGEIKATVTLRDKKTGKIAKFSCKNIPDVGYIVTPVTKNIDKDFEERAVKYLKKYPPIPTNMRM